MRIHFILIGAALSMQAYGASQNCCPPNATSSPGNCCQEHTYAYLNSARHCVCDPCARAPFGGAIDLSLLYWQAREDGLAFAIKNGSRLGAAANLSADINGKMQTIGFNWEPAFKLNFEMEFANSWDFDARWTYFYTRSTSSVHAETNALTGSGLLPLWVIPQSNVASPSVFGKARGIWHLHLNAADFELGYHPLLTNKFNLRLHFGLKGISISQQMTVKYSNGIDDGLITLLPSRVAMRNRCLGLGPRFGFNSEWQLKKGWSLLADGAASFSLSVFNLKRKDSDQALQENPASFYNTQSKFRESFYAYRPNLEALLGAGWASCFGCRKQYSFDFKAAYEVQYFWDQNMLRQMASSPISFSAFSMRGDLHCHGVSTTLRFGF